MLINRSLLASVLIILVYVINLLFDVFGGSVSDFKIWGVVLDIFTPVIVYFFSKLAFGDAALNSWVVVIVTVFMSLRFILQ